MQSKINPWDSMSDDRNRLEKLINNFLTPISNKLISPLEKLPGGTILDIATGTGEPGITLAEINPALQVIGIDNSIEMLKMANQNAQRRNISNYSTYHCDASEIPFDNEKFDAIICRNGIMFFSDLAKALQEMHRLLKPGGSIHISTWGQLSKNLWLDIILSQVSALTHTKSYRTYTPGMLYCMQPGFTSEWLDITGFRNIREQETTGVVSFDSFEEFWDYVTTVSSAVIHALKPLNESAKEEVRKMVSRQLSMHIILGKLYFQWTSNITEAIK